MAEKHELVWGRCLSIIKDVIDWQPFKTWFEPIKPVKLEKEVLTIQVPSQFFYEYLEENYIGLIGKALRRELGKNARLEYRIVMDGKGGKANPVTINMPTGYNRPRASNQMDLPLAVGNVPSVKNPFIIPGLKRVKIDSQLNPNYIFETFIEGDCNRVARRAGMAIAQKPGATSFNPLVIYGGGGLGKTHLAQAVGNEVKNLHPNKSVLYVSTQKFINQFVDSARRREINDFIHFYQLIDVLIIDDIQFFSKAEKTQDAFFTIFNHLHQSGKQLILTSDKSPKEIEGVESRLLSRFRWGLNADIQVPDFDTRMEILVMKQKADGMEIPEEVIKYVAYNVTSNVRELEGALISLLAQSSLNKKEINIHLAKKVLKSFIEHANKELTIGEIQKIVSEYYSVPFEKLAAKTRKREIVQARQVSMYFAKMFTKSSLKTIGDHFGGRDHTTVIHSCQTVQNLMETDTNFKDGVLNLQQQLQLASI